MATFMRSPIVLPDAARSELAASLGLVLVDAIALRQGIQLAHWNVFGPSFIQFHVLFDDGQAIVAASIDRIAERIVTLGALVGANVERVGEVMRIPDYPLRGMTQLEHVAEVASRFDGYLAGLKAASDIATRLNEPGTVNLLGEAIDAAQVYAWKLVKHLEPAQGAPAAVPFLP